MDLLASRLWRVGITVDISASALQAAALRFGPLSLVQPILVCDLLFAAMMNTAVACLGPRKGLPLATAFACGAVFGVTAFLLKEITQTIGRRFSPPSQQWPLYAFIILEPVGFLLNKNAFQESTLIASALAISTVTDPLVAIAIGLVFLNERIASGPADIAAEAAGGLHDSGSLRTRAPVAPAGRSDDRSDPDSVPGESSVR